MEIELLKKDLIDNYKLNDLEVLANYYNLSLNVDLQSLVTKIAIAIYEQMQRAEMPKRKIEELELKEIKPVDYSKVTYSEVKNLCRNDKEISKGCDNGLIWKEWAISHPQDLDGAFISAVEEGNKRLVEILLDNGANIDAVKASMMLEPTALELAAKKGHTDILRLLIKRGIKVDPDSEYILLLAIHKGHIGIAKLLLEAGVKTSDPDVLKIQKEHMKGSKRKKILSELGIENLKKLTFDYKGVKYRFKIDDDSLYLYKGDDEVGISDIMYIENSDEDSDGDGDQLEIVSANINDGYAGKGLCKVMIGLHLASIKRLPAEIIVNISSFTPLQAYLCYEAAVKAFGYQTTDDLYDEALAYKERLDEYANNGGIIDDEHYEAFQREVTFEKE